MALDTESNTYNKGSWSDERFKGVCWSFATEEGSGVYPSTSEGLGNLSGMLEDPETLIVGFNWKYDLNVFRRLGVDLSSYRCFDCQLAEFIVTYQKQRYPSLEGCLVKYGLGHKLDIVATEYWAKGIQTEDVPQEILYEYAEQDAVKTLELYHHYMRTMTPAQKKLHQMMCMDLIILAEMEWNGIIYDEGLCEKRSEEITAEIQSITDELSKLYPNVPINFGSGDQLSAFLYGGIVKEEVKEHVGFFKTGKQAGEPKYANRIIEHELPRLVQPIRGSELSKPGVFATNADTLLKLRGNRKTKRVIELIQRQVRLGTLLSKSYEGLRKSNRDGHWTAGRLHGSYNQCVVQTGRLSSSNPNLQNLDAAAQDLFVTRYPN